MRDIEVQMKESKRILIIDDDQDILETYRDILSPQTAPDVLNKGRSLFDSDNRDTFGPGSVPPSYDVTLACNGSRGVEEVEHALSRQQPFAVAFVDMKMPGLDGARTSRNIWCIDPDIKIVIVTAYSEYSPAEITRIVGRNDIFYLRKPFNPGEILQFARALTHEWNLEKKRDELEKKFQNINESLESKVKEQTSIIVQTEKMATVGLLASGVAHEINTPLAFVNSNLATVKSYLKKISMLNSQYETVISELAKTVHGPEEAAALADIRRFRQDHKIDFIMSDLENLSDESIEGIDRIKTIVRNLKFFSRADQADLKRIDINEILDTALGVLWSELSQKAKIEKQYSDLPLVQCYPQKISQVFTNLLINAGQAIENQGIIRISTGLVTPGPRERTGWVEIRIEDTGCGISKIDQNRIFDPFFSTKPVGTGTGLGLSIVYEVIKTHHGEISVDSSPGFGSCFTVRLPVCLNHGTRPDGKGGKNGK